MKQEPPAGPGSALDRLARGVERRPVLLVAGWSVVYFALTLRISAQKQFWDDEFFTFRLARLPRFADVWTALLTGADQHPPSFYWITHWSLEAFGGAELAARLPAMIGFWWLTLCVFAFASRHTSAFYAAAAMVFPAVTGAYWYASEARGYGMAMGFGGTALVAWQRATEGGGRRRRALAVLAIALMGVVCSHYYAILILVPLAAGELWRSAARRRLDPAVWAAFAAAAAPLAAFWPVIEAARTYAPGFWARPYWPDVFLYYGRIFGFSIIFLTGVLGAASVLLCRPDVARHGFDRLTSAARTHELVALLAALAQPLTAMVMAKVVTNAFHPRYVLSPVFAWGVLFVVVVHALARGRRLAGAALALLFGASFVLLWRETLYEEAGRRADFDRWVAVLEATDAAVPVVAAEPYVFYKLSYYAPPPLAKRITYLADARCELQYLAHDTVDRGMLDLKPWTGLNVQPYRAFVRERPAFFVFGYIGDWSWLTYRLPTDRVAAYVAGRAGRRLLLSVARGDVALPLGPECGAAVPAAPETPGADTSSAR
jgi:hypothetical protein